LTVKTSDSLQLVGHWTQVDSAKATIILVHGIGACKEQFFGLAKRLATQQIEAIFVDSRAHGQSEGTYTTYGFKEKNDIALLVDQIEQMYPSRPIGIWGNSLGGAVAIQALEHDERIDFGIIESTFTELDQIIYDYMDRWFFGLGIRTLSDKALKKAGKIADFAPDQVKPIQSVRNIEQPVFFAHGSADKSISAAYGKALHDAAASTEKEFYLVEGAGHNNVANMGGTAYQKKLELFINQHVDQRLNE